ncbi:MAG: lysine--tRNA ligase [Epsilonproteobacteria bacterium]|nr:lysine--tRNA ligase [Campylobacterota bacterium]NPA63947.1 lysine--tRNA ligase [Campylobacterota bacterium]
MFDNQYEQLRIQKAKELKEAGINPYGHGFCKEMSNKEFLEKYAYVKEREDRKDESVCVRLNGRIKFLRHMGKAAFAKIEDESAIVQIYFNRDSLGEEWFKKVKKLIEVGDIVEAVGYPFVTKTGELTLHAKELNLVTKAIVPLPEKFHGLQDKELRYRQRYVDLIMNPEVKKVFVMRSRIVSLIRSFFEEHGFLEVETPMMHPIPGGANARPFITHHNALGVDRYLRIAPELYLKRLIVGGFEAVFEINRNFRNEGMDATHNPEFTMIEFYWAYHTYEDLMKLTEELFDYLFERLALPKELPYGEHLIDFSTPFSRIKYKDAIVEIGGIPNEVVESKEAIIDLLEQKGLKPKKAESMSLGMLQAELFDNFVEDKLINPTFITHFPIDISPLARRSDTDPNIAERFELFIAGKEIANGFNELNDPLDQYERFKAQVANKDVDDEAMHMDEDFVRALGYGMPPTAGEGIGIDRLVMLLTNQHSIRDVILFPAMRPKEGEN